MNLNPLVKFFAIIFVSMVCGLLAPDYFSVVFIFISTVLLWFTETIPLPATGLYVPISAILLGVLPPEKAFEAFSNPIIFLFIGSFMLSKAFESYGLDKRIAYNVLSIKFLSKSITRITITISLICFFFSMWISNTAACVIMTPISLGICRALKSSNYPKEKLLSYQSTLLLITAFSSSIGGIATPIGSPPNLIAISLLQGKGYSFGFLEWMYYGFPLALTMLLILIGIYIIKFPSHNMDTIEIQLFLKQQLPKIGKISTAEIQIALVFLATVGLWILPGILKEFSFDSTPLVFLQQNITMEVASILGVLTLFLLPRNYDGSFVKILTWDSASKIDWGTILLFSGGLTLGAVLNESGLSDILGKGILSFAKGNFFLFGFLAVALSLILSELSSNTASASIIIPIIMVNVTELGNGNILSIIIASAIGASFGFMLPISTPPNAIIFGTGLVPLKDMIRLGVLFDIFGIIIISIFLFYFYPLISF